MTFLMFDYDESTASIGGPPGVEQALGLPPITVEGGIHRFQNVLESVFAWEETTIDHPVVGDVAPQTKRRIVPNESGHQHDLGGIVVDSFTRLAQYELRRTLQRQNAQREQEGKEPLDNLTKSWWGNYGDLLVRQLVIFAKMDVTVVCTAHETIETDEVGKRYHTINMKGSAADKAPEYFDVVAFLGSDGDGPKKDRYLRVADSRAYRQAKDRKNLLGGRVDFVRNGKLVRDCLAQIVQTYRANGTRHPNILIVGPSGAGKTLLMGTLHPLTDEVGSRKNDQHTPEEGAQSKTATAPNRDASSGPSPNGSPRAR